MPQKLETIVVKHLLHSIQEQRSFKLLRFLELYTLAFKRFENYAHHFLTFSNAFLLLQQTHIKEIAHNLLLKCLLQLSELLTTTYILKTFCFLCCTFFFLNGLQVYISNTKLPFSVLKVAEQSNSYQ